MKTYEECLKSVRDVLVEHCSVTIEPIDENLHLQSDLGLDSMALLNLALEIENKFELCLEEDPEQPPETVGEVARLVVQRLEDIQ